ncbi:MAG: cytochrome c [Methyloprofundus sp.]|nr:cytochrome c [Methyloprofundus sp.]
MKQYKLSFAFVLLALGLAQNSLAAVDINAGKQRAKMCLSCHGQDGNSQTSNIPSLAGQKPAYIANQLRSFRSGVRKGGMMNNMAKGLSDAEINNLAAFFASLKNKSIGSKKKQLIQEGKELASGMCFGCHGSNAQGMGVTPRLAGQQPKYLVKQLRDFKNKTRKNPMMGSIAAGFSDDEIKALAEYMSSLK